MHIYLSLSLYIYTHISGGVYTDMQTTEVDGSEFFENSAGVLVYNESSGGFKRRKLVLVNYQ